jgi:hypothetical protein
MADSLRPRAARIKRSDMRQRRRRAVRRRTSKLLAEDEEFEIAICSWAAAKDEEVDQQAEESIEVLQPGKRGNPSSGQPSTHPMASGGGGATSAGRTRSIPADQRGIVSRNQSM